MPQARGRLGESLEIAARIRSFTNFLAVTVIARVIGGRRPGFFTL
jgi:hypothetical protein